MNDGKSFQDIQTLVIELITRISNNGFKSEKENVSSTIIELQDFIASNLYDTATERKEVEADIKTLLKMRKEYKSLRNLNILSFTIVPLSFAVATFIFLMIVSDVRMGYSKEQIDQSIRVMIVNNSDLTTLDFALKNPRIDNPSRTTKFERYPDNVNLNDVLMSLKAEHYTQTNPETQFLNKLNAIIIEHNEVDPFSKLLNHQKDLFDNVRFKAKGSYNDIDDDINKIAQELYSKNKLVDEYLDKSNLSFWVSVFGLVIALLTTLVQFIATRKNKYVLQKL
ncbi:hypothetical protein Q4601_06885 [Shewanella sp. 1_MG-2023]|uniref:hypothetical protein n=1 Tax=unclassified Shewanella TaxID=196818 RepID=UPI0026E2289A|nr:MULTISPECIES: hypothetical protein [unclassified Shewanella]MDO6611947.1 hypothetical protein [Shewanella sp. 7_MG-2023]MDO6771802.1 hypothetical protein [Shewanella sp. 2_MG-2023]MDO6794028.1 hypothetical protein [Shewanella sp. 1_MG-2023]